ncbi:MAG: hypothetical protein KIT12_10830 [Trueperaceae bacterium]|nr:hypothetical protein [Trueperaceae bacterium]
MNKVTQRPGMVCAGAFRLASRIGANRALAVTGCAACLAALVALLGHTAANDPKALAIFGGMLVAAYLFETIFPKLSGRPPRDRRGKRKARSGSTLAP